MRENPYVQIEDKHGAHASIYINPSDQHEVHYYDDQGHKFYTEVFDHISIEAVEQSVMDWATGKRELFVCS